MHRALRPSWSCEDCGQAWPCRARRATLPGECEFDRIAMRLFLAQLMYEAVEDIDQYSSDVVPGLYERFLGWVRHVDRRSCEAAASSTEELAATPGVAPAEDSGVTHERSALTRHARPAA